MMNLFTSRPSGASLVAMAFGALLAAALSFFGEKWGLSVLLRSLIWASTMALLAGGMAIFRNYRQKPVSQLPGRAAKAVKGGAAEESSLLLNELRIYLRHRYGRFWRYKVRFLALVGHSSGVEKAVPGLMDSQWLEANGVVAIWGGSLTSAADSGRIRALKKLKRRAISAFVLVYEAQQRHALPADAIARQLNERYKALGWRVPLYLWEVQQSAWPQEARETQPVGVLLPPRCQPEGVVQALEDLPPQLTQQGVQQGLIDSHYAFLLHLGQQLRHGAIAQFKALSAPLLSGPYAVPLRGVMFSLPVATNEEAERQRWLPDPAWYGILDDLPSLHQQRQGVAWEQSLCQLVLVALGLSCCAMLLSWNVNRHAMNEDRLLAQQASDEHLTLEQRLVALDKLQSRIGQLQYRAQHGAPWYSRFGLSQNQPLLTALWPEYARSALPLIRDAASAQLQNQLMAWNTLPAESEQRAKLSKSAYNQLKAWLMLSRAEKMDAAFFSSTLMALWPRREQVRAGVWQYEGPKLLAFMAQNLPAHPEWQRQADAALIATSRSALLRVIGMRNAESALYQKMLAQVAHNYADMRLSDMTGDTDVGRLFVSDRVVPGMFTRQAWREAVQPAITKVVETRRDEIDWVLSDSRQPAAHTSASPEALKARLTERYFTDYAGAWLGFLNSLRWQKAATLSDAIDQLTLLADVRQSPLVALMNTLEQQGRAGQQQERLADSLLKSTQNLLQSDPARVIDQKGGLQDPLDETFGPLLGLSDSNSRNNSLSLQTFLTRVTRVRLKFQQVTNTADPQAMMQALAQTVFQGKSVDVSDTRDYGSLVAASLGQEWSGFGQTVFVQPMEQAWQQVLAPTAQSINAQWQHAVVSDWEHDFNGRYPFAEHQQSEASLPLLAQYLRNDTGRITEFVKTSLGGVLRKEGRHWVPDAIAAQGLHFNPEFISALNRLNELADILFASGDAQVQFQLQGKPSRNVMRTQLRVDQQKLDYHNQQESWQTFNWPDNKWKPRATLSWVSLNAGERLYGDYPGSWGFIRLLDKAQVTQVDSSTYLLGWKASDSNRLNLMMRTEAGKGPLALLMLKEFRLPQQVFLTGGE